MSTETYAQRWRDDHEKVAAVEASVAETYSGPWGLKASEEDVIYGACKALGIDVDFDRDRERLIGPLAEKLYEWNCEAPSPLVEGLSSLVADGLAPGSTVPVEEIAGRADTASWETRQAQVILDLIQDREES